MTEIIGEVARNAPDMAFGPFSDYVANQLSKKIVGRKINLCKPSAMLGHIALLLPESYGAS